MYYSVLKLKRTTFLRSLLNSPDFENQIKDISNLFLTRGVPGTHDTKMLLQCIKNLKNDKFKKINIPKFDKSIDDRLKKNKWLKVKKKPHIVIFEGWCVGVKAQKNKDLISPINKLEKQEDIKKHVILRLDSTHWYRHRPGAQSEIGPGLVFLDVLLRTTVWGLTLG